MILALDTSGKNLGLALCKNNEIVAATLSQPGLKHGEILQNEVAGFLDQAGKSFKNISGISVTLGPGSFTGLRIGLAAAKGYAYALDIPLTGISTLFAQACFCKNTTNRIITIIDAPQNQFYYAGFDCSMGQPEQIFPDSAGDLDEIKSSIDNNTIIVGPDHLREQFVAELTFNDYHICDNFNLAVPAGLWGEKMILASNILDKAEAVPMYIKTGF